MNNAKWLAHWGRHLVTRDGNRPRVSVLSNWCWLDNRHYESSRDWDQTGTLAQLCTQKQKKKQKTKKKTKRNRKGKSMCKWVQEHAQINPCEVKMTLLPGRDRLATWPTEGSTDPQNKALFWQDLSCSKCNHDNKDAKHLQAKEYACNAMNTVGQRSSSFHAHCIWTTEQIPEDICVTGTENSQKIWDHQVWHKTPCSCFICIERRNTEWLEVCLTFRLDCQCAVGSLGLHSSLLLAVLSQQATLMKVLPARVLCFTPRGCFFLRTSIIPFRLCSQ